MKIKIESFQPELEVAIDLLRGLHPARFAHGGACVTVRIEPSLGKGACRAEVAGGWRVTVTGGDAAGAMRALGRVMGAALHGRLEPFDERPFTNTLGLMVDCSCNAVPTAETFRRFILRAALMGFNTLQLYIEDLYPVEGEPFFGYLRGAYTEDELRSLDDFAASCGVELVAAIQTLGHMDQFLQWPAARRYRDNDGVLCALTDETYDLIGRCLDSVSRIFRSRRVNIGMDEAWGVGEGEFRQRVGDVPRNEILRRHLARVLALCRERGLSPMMWSDMVFRLGSATFGYYDGDDKTDRSAEGIVPDGVGLCYWDYYGTDAAHYERQIDRHRRIGANPLFFGGTWTWNRMWNALRFSIAASDAAMAACRAKGVREAYLTLWGDDGAECDYETAYPGMQHFAELAYAADGRIDARTRASNLLGSCGLAWADCEAADMVNTNDFFPDGERQPSDAQKGLFWQDPVFPLYDPQVGTRTAEASIFYGRLSRRLSAAARRSPEAGVFGLQALAARVISLRLGLREALRRAVIDGDRAAARRLVRSRLRPLRSAVERHWRMRRQRWLDTCKPFGWEVIEARYATLSGRLASLDERLSDWCAGRIGEIPELAAEMRVAWPDTAGTGPLLIPGSGAYARLRTPSRMK